MLHTVQVEEKRTEHMRYNIVSNSPASAAMGAGKNWASIESLFACKAFVRVSEDPVRGNGRKYEVFASQVLAAYEVLTRDFLDTDNRRELDKAALMSASATRTGDAIIQRYKRVRKTCLEFEACVQQIRACKPTGDPTEEDVSRAATAVLNGKAEPRDMYNFFNGAGDPGKPFQFVQQLEYLRGTSLWKTVALTGLGNSAAEKDAARAFSHAEVLGAVTTVLTDSASDSPVPGSDGSAALAASDSAPDGTSVPDAGEFKRPKGSKKAIAEQESKRTLERSARAIESLAAASSKRAKIAEQLVKVEEQKMQMQLFSMPGASEASRKLFLREMEAAALKKIGINEGPAMGITSEHDVNGSDTEFEV